MKPFRRCPNYKPAIYTMTINRAQEQSLKFAEVNLETPRFFRVAQEWRLQKRKGRSFRRKHRLLSFAWGLASKINFTNFSYFCIDFIRFVVLNFYLRVIYKVLYLLCVPIEGKSVYLRTPRQHLKWLHLTL